MRNRLMVKIMKFIGIIAHEGNVKMAICTCIDSGFSVRNSIP